MPISYRKFQRIILDHYQKHGRKNLPWKLTRDPYKILVSEVMLQQTQVSRVLPKYQEFLRAFPSVRALAKAQDAKLLRVWQGLGYWRRAKYLKATAQTIVKNHDGKFPRDIETLESLPGIGPYTARAVACFAFNSPEVFIDTNIRRVYLHFFFPKRKNVRDEEILRVATRALYQKDSRMWHYALFDYGATVLKDKAINRRSRHYAKQSAFNGSFRSFRTSLVQLLLKQPNHRASRKTIEHFLQTRLQAGRQPYTVQQIIDSLLKDNLVKQTSRSYQL